MVDLQPTFYGVFTHQMIATNYSTERSEPLNVTAAQLPVSRFLKGKSLQVPV